MLITLIPAQKANDSAMKMIWYYNNALNRPEKKKIISRFKAYHHGITIASGSLTGIPMMHNDFDLPLKQGTAYQMSAFLA